MNLQELRQKRLKWVEANRENGFDDGIKRLLTDLYPDNAHFIYELLQNAEDARASEARFILKEDSVEFEHNGDRLFSIKDVESITSIGISTKKDDHTNIGKFGVGFKAVFAYTSTPEIKSGEYHFRIRDLVVPDTEGLTSLTLGENETRFLFPFDNPQKPPERAYEEIETNLRQLDESTLVFLSNIKKIEYLLPDSTLGFMEQKETDGNRIEILVQHPEDSDPVSVIFLRFEKQVDVLDENDKLKSYRIAAAFGLEKTKEQNWKIKPLEPGRVCIYFPAEKETSNLRFHLHAPFASTVARDSVRDCPANDGLRDHLAELVAESMSNIRDQGLLDVAFLATLPNDKDNLSSFYKPIMKRLIEAFNYKKLTPMKQGGHAAASWTFRGQARLSNLISDSDLVTILGEDYSPPIWITNPPQLNQREDNFLSMLGISEWTTEYLVNELSGNSEPIMKWLGEKHDEWHQRLYVLLGDDFLLNAYPSYVATRRKDKLSKLLIIRCSDGKYRVGSECYFPRDDVEHDEQFPRVAKGVYSSGKNKREQEKAHKFLEEMGIRERDLVEEVIKEILPKYTDTSVMVESEDNKRDFQKIERAYKTDSQKKKERLQKELRKTPFILVETPSTGESIYRKPDEIYFTTEALRVYFAENDSVAFVDSEYPKSAKKLLRELGVTDNVRIYKKEKNSAGYITIDEGYYYKRGLKGFDPGIKVDGLETAINRPSPQKCAFIWNKIAIPCSDCIRGTVLISSRQDFSPDASTYREEKVTSENFGCLLIDTAWLPDSNGKMHKPSDIALDDLHESFVQDEKLADQLRMKKNVVAKLAEEIGISTRDIELLRQDPEGFRQWKAERELKEKKPEFPERVSANPEYRKKQLRNQVKDAPKKEYETRERSTRITRGEIEPDIYLRNQYTNQHDQLICQICKEEMPFKKRDGEYYFEAIEALSGDYFHKEHEAQFLALCPECAARYKEFVKRDETILSKLHHALKGSDRPEMPLKLGKLETSLRFVETHWRDMKTILQIPVVDRSDTWSEQDQKDLTTASLKYAATLYPEEEDLV